MKKLLSPYPFWQDSGLGLIRILVGLMMTYHGVEVFSPAKMEVYLDWNFKLGSPAFMAYLGKGIEFFGGVLFTIGLFTRLVCIPLIFTMAFITFILNEGKIFTDHQHPFLFVVIFLIYFFTGPGKLSLDYVLFGRRK